MLLCLAPVTALAFVAPHGIHRPVAICPPVVFMQDNPPPPEVIEAEAKATPNRKYRLLGAGTGFAISLGSGVLSFAVLTGGAEASPIVLFDNPILSLLVDLVIGGSCAWAIQQELKTKAENTQRIWEEVQRRRAGGAASGANRSQRRAKKVVDTRPPQFTGGGGFATPSPSPPPPPPLAAPTPAAADAASSDGGGGWFESLTSALPAGAKDLLEEANALGKDQWPHTQCRTAHSI